MSWSPYSAGEMVMGDGGIFGDIIGDAEGDDAGSYVMGEEAGWGLGSLVPASVQARFNQGRALLRQYGPVAAQMHPGAAAVLRQAQRYGVSGDFSGAETTLARPAALPQQVAYNPQFSPRVVEYRGFAPSKPRRVPLGFTSDTTVLPGTSQRVISRPQVPMRVERLVVPSDIAGVFAIVDLKVGNKSQFPASGAVPARTFQENAVGVDLQGDTAYPAIDIVIEVLNTSGASSTFRAALIGMTVQELV